MRHPGSGAGVYLCPARQAGVKSGVSLRTKYG